MKKNFPVLRFVPFMMIFLMAISSLFAETAADVNGDFTVRTKPGDYTLEITFIGYEKFRKKIKLKAGETLTKRVQLKISYFEIGGIIVIAEKELLPTEATTKTRILTGMTDPVNL